MRKYLLLVIFVSIAGLLFAGKSYSPILRTDHLSFQGINTPHQLADYPIISFSDSVFVHGQVIPRLNYTLNYQTGSLIFADSLASKSFSIRYAIYPPVDMYYLYQPTTLADSLLVRQIKKKRSALWNKTKLNISGSKTISLSFSNTSDLDVNQSLYLKIDGELSANMNIQAQISDSQSPLTPAGNSKELSSLDKLFLRLYGHEYELAFGDLDIEFSQTRFINYKPVFEGLRLAWSKGIKAMAALALTSGQAQEVEFYGQAGIQGPYYLATDNSTSILIVPGSEKVYLQGSHLNRGRDYSIDYSEGTITFSSQRFIGQNSHFRVTYIYETEDFKQNLYLASTKYNITDKLTVQAHAIYQADDKNNPTAFDYTPDEKASLAAAGDNTAWVDGATLVPAGEGDYIQKTTDNITYYEYAPADSSATYLLSFTYVGTSQGNYNKSGIGQYTYVGTGMGTWVARRILTAPIAKRNFDVLLTWQDSLISGRSEFLSTAYDKNLFSEKDDNDNNAFASYTVVQIHPDWDRLEPKLEIAYQTQSAHLETFADIKEASRVWELGSMQIADSLAKTSVLTQLSLSPTGFMQKISHYYVKASNFARLAYLSSDTRLNEHKYYPGVNIHAVYASSHTDNLQRHDKLALYTATSVYTHSYFGISSLHNLRHATSNTTSMTGSHYLLDKYSFCITPPRIKLKASYTTELNQMLFSSWQNTNKTFTNEYLASLDDDFSTLDARYQHKQTRDYEAGNPLAPTKFDMAELTYQLRLFKDAIRLHNHYELKNTQFYPKERRLVYVGKATGVYDSTGVYATNGEYDWLTETVGEPELSIEINDNARLNIAPRLYWPRFPWQALESETSFNLVEQSRSSDKWSIYLLRPAHLMNAQTSIYARHDFRQKFMLELIKRRVHADIKYTYLKTLDQRYLGAEVDKKEIKEVLLRFLKLSIHALELSYTISNEHNSHYQSFIKAQKWSASLRTRLPAVVLTSRGSISQEDGHGISIYDNYQLTSTRLSERLDWYYKRKYRLSSSIDWRFNKKDSNALDVLEDKRNGHVIKWDFQLQYQLNKYTRTSLDYKGTSIPNKETEHELSVEVKAEF